MQSGQNTLKWYLKIGQIQHICVYKIHDIKQLFMGLKQTFLLKPLLVYPRALYPSIHLKLHSHYNAPLSIQYNAGVVQYSVYKTTQ